MKKRTVANLGILVASAVTLFCFQNCGKFQPNQSVQAVQSSDVTPIGTGTVALASVVGVANTAFQTCFAAAPADANGLATCLNSQTNANALYSAAAIATCLGTNYSTAVGLALCLTNAGQVIQDYRAPKQDDFDLCSTSVASTDLAACLTKHGVDSGVTQAAINTCVAGGGEATLETCLRTAGALPPAPPLFQADVDLCNWVEGGTAKIAGCLSNSGLLPATVTQSVINTCVAAETETGVVACLRNNFYVPKALMQVEINRCNAAVGSANIATCLSTQGLLPAFGGVAVLPATFQTAIDGCVTAAGETGVAACLRKNADLEMTVMQPHINDCYNFAGSANVFTCLTANFPALPAGLTAAALNTCFALNTPASAAGTAKCLASTFILDAAPGQDQIKACSNFAGVDPDTTGTKPGEIGVAACLAGSGVLPAALTQAEIDTCVTSVGFPAVSSCLNTKAIVPSFQLMNATGGVFAVNCASCHNAITLAGTMNLSVYASVLAAPGAVIKGNAAQSVMYVDVNTAVMPEGAGAKKLTPPEIALIELWINQGAANN